jgi:hypothetical protein
VGDTTLKTVIATIALMIPLCCSAAQPSATAEEGKPVAWFSTDKPDSDAVQWRAHCDLEDGRRLITDGSLLVEARFLPKVPVPEKSVPATAAQRLMASETDREFGLASLERQSGAGGHYLGPGGIQLSRKYVELLRGSALKATLRFRSKGLNDPVLILDGRTVVGVMMPMKKA